MANFAVAASQDTIEFASKVMEMYAREGEKKEDTLLRILNIAEAESVKGTHPELEDSLKTIETTIATLIKQINGVVAGQDTQLTDLKKRLNEAIEEKRTALETSKVQIEAAQAKSEAADATIKQAQADSELVKTQAQAEIDAAKKDASIEIERAKSERDQAIRERDDARTIASEKTANNDLLMRQMAAMETDIASYKALQEKHKELQSSHSSLTEKSKDILRDAENTKKENERILADLNDAQVTNKELAEENRKLLNKIAELEQKAIKSTGDAELAAEKAVFAKEREMQALIREADKENAKLSALIDILQDQMKGLTENSEKQEQ